MAIEFQDVLKRVLSPAKTQSPHCSRALGSLHNNVGRGTEARSWSSPAKGDRKLARHKQEVSQRSE